MSKTSVVRAAKRKRRHPPARVSGAKGGQSKPRQPYKAPDSALSISHANLLYFLSEGPIVGPVNGLESVKLDGTPMRGPDGGENFPGASWDFRPGTVDQDHIPGFPVVENEITQGFPVELRSDAPWTRAITDPQLSAVRIRLAWPQIWEVKSNGDQVGYRIDYVIELSVDGGSFQPYLNATLNDKGTTEYERSHRVDLPEGFTSALVRVRRLTANRNDVNWADTMRIKALTEVIDAKLRYPNLALGALRFDASQFQNIPKFSLRARGRIIRVPSNYDPETRAYTGNWNGTFKQAYTNNPAWIWYDLLLHRRYGLGRRITPDMVDKWTLYEIGRYCDVMVKDGLGGLEPRMTTNVYIQDQVEGYALLSDLASVFRGSSCWNGSMVTMVADIPGNEDGYVFTRSNIIGEFEYGAVAWPDRHTRVKVSYDNPANDFKTEPVPVTNEELIGILGHRQKDISAFGCTSQGQAMRHGVWLLKTEQHESWTVGFTTGMEGRNVEPGQIICIADELFSGRVSGGRIRAATKRVITLDLAAQIQPEDRLILNLPSGKTEGRIVKSVAGHEVTLLADYSELPQPESSWSVESADLAVMRFRVQTIEPHGLHQFEIKAVQHEPGKYDAIDNGARIDPQPISIIPPGVMSPPENIQIEARSSIAQGLAVTTMRISWDAAKGAVSYNVEWRKDSGSWIRLPSNGTLGAEVEGVYSGRYIARVSAVNALGVASVWGSSMEVLLAGKVGLPPALTHLTTHSRLFEIGLNWGFPPGAEDTQHTEIWYSPSNSLESAAKLSDLAYPQNDHRLQSLAAGAQVFFWARLVDRTGNIGPFFPEKNGVMGQASAEAGPVLELIAGQIGETELGKELLDRIELIDGDGSGSVNDRLNQAKKELEGLIDEITDALEYDNTKAYASGEVVRLGNRLFQAITATTGHPPPDATYWLDMGTLAETTNALVLQVLKNSASIIEQDGKITAQAEQLSAINAKVTDPVTGLEATASGLNSLTSTVETLDGKVTATAEKVDGVYAYIDSGSAGDENGSAGDERASAGAESLMSVIAERDFAQAVRTDKVEAQVGENAASIIDVAKASADASSALASKISQVSAQVGETSAAVEVVSKAQADLEGKAAAMWSVKMQVNANGQLVTAGIGLGIETNAEGVTQSQFLVSADRFAVVGALAGGQVFTPFVVENGQVFMASAFIQDGTITNAKIGDYIQSNNYVPGMSGWKLFFDGTFEINGAFEGQARQVINNRGGKVFDENGVKRYQWGDLFA